MKLRKKPIKPTKRIMVSHSLWVNDGKYSLEDVYKFFCGYNKNEVTFLCIYNRKFTKYGCSVIGHRKETEQEFGDRVRAYYKEAVEYYDWYRDNHVEIKKQQEEDSWEFDVILKQLEIKNGN
jgi:hypothetical protein